MDVYQVEADVDFANGVGTKQCLLQVEMEGGLKADDQRSRAADLIHSYFYDGSNGFFPVM